jgi:hypothetical protein
VKENKFDTVKNAGNKNSIEEDIKNAEHFIKSIKTDKEYKEENGWHGYYNKEIVELARILQHILSDYKRVLKENEKLNKLHIQDNKHLDFIMKHSISVQKVKDKIEEEIKYHEKNILDIENTTILKSKTAKEEAEIEFNKYAIVVLNKMLQELIEERKVK